MSELIIPLVIFFIFAGGYLGFLIFSARKVKPIYLKKSKSTKRIYGKEYLPGDSGTNEPVYVFRDIPIDDPIPEGYTSEYIYQDIPWDSRTLAEEEGISLPSPTSRMKSFKFNKVKARSRSRKTRDTLRKK